MGTEHLAEFRIAMLLTGVKIQASADLISKASVIVLQNFRIPADFFLAFQVIYQGLPFFPL